MADTVDDLKKQVKILEKLVQSIQSQLWPLESEVRNLKRWGLFIVMGNISEGNFRTGRDGN
jgi:hypothetical protein